MLESGQTIRYRLNLPNALLPISPALSALHTSRAAALHPEIATLLRPSHCTKCGTYRFSGDHPTYPPTKKQRRRVRSSKSRQKKCRLCGFSETPISSPDNSSVPVQLPNDLLGTESQESTDTLHPIAATGTITTSVPASSTSGPGRQSHPKSNHAKTSTLKDMLSRNRQREEGTRHKKRQEDHGGLAAFLKKL